ARHFQEQDIDEFRDCFYLNSGPKGQITKINELRVIMRSLGMSVTIEELHEYFKEKGGKLSFADFLDVMYTHSKKERIPDEIAEAFRAHDRSGSNQIHVKELRHILCEWGERLEPKEVEKLFVEANINSSFVKYHDFIKIISAPLPDY
ncbi:calmodulin-like protein, partial [Leptotrombidium deliense]